MKPDKSKAVLGLLALVVIASGCTQTDSGEVTTTQTQALSIQEFTAFPTEVFEGNSVQLRTVVKNTGGSEASSVEMEIFNIPLGGGNQQWQVSGGNNPIDYTSGTPLTPPDPDSGVPSTPRERTLTLEAPDDLRSSVTIPYDIKGRLTFTYETTGVSEIQLMGQQRYRDTGAARTKPSVDNTGGPIQMEVRTRTPIVFYEGNDTASQLCVVVRNEGTGTPYIPGGDIGSTEDADKVELTASSPEFGLSSVESGGSTMDIEMVGSRGVGCYEFTGLSSGPDIQTTVPATFTAEYQYAKETSTSVTVKGQ